MCPDAHRVGGERVRRSKAIGEIGEIDQRTGELDYSRAFTWDAETDSFERSDSSLLDEIQRERGWTRTERKQEIRRRKRFLQLLSDIGTTDYRAFTALVNEYYADPERVMDRLEAADPPAGGADVGGSGIYDDEGVGADGGG